MAGFGAPPPCSIRWIAGSAAVRWSSISRINRSPLPWKYDANNSAGMAITNPATVVSKAR